MAPSLVAAIRAVRPWIPLVSLSYFLLLRIGQSLWVGYEASAVTSFLGVVLSCLISIRSYLDANLVQMQIGDLWRSLLSRLLNLSFTLFEDILGLLMVQAAARLAYVLYHQPLSDWTDQASQSIYIWLLRFDFVSKKVEKELEDMRPSLEKSMGKTDQDRGIVAALPPRGRDLTDISKQLVKASTKEHTKWEGGKVSGAVYVSGTDRARWDTMMADVFRSYSFANPLHAGAWPRLNQCEAEVIAMTARMMKPDGRDLPVGCMTSGGTESIMLAIKAHLQLYGVQRGIHHPELICGSTAHASVDKACELYGIRMVVVDCDDSDTSNRFQLSPVQVRKRVTSNTIMIYASAPNYPQGTIDPIEELGEIAAAYDIGLHVDSCLGGFVLPFLPSHDVPLFDFRVPGVTSMSADTHKFGASTKGTSVVLYRDVELRQAQYFCYPRWTGGLYCTPTLAGSRPGALPACAWAAMMAIGEAGYRDKAAQLVAASRRLAEGIRGTDGIWVLGGDKPTMVVCFGAEKDDSGRPVLDVYRVLDLMSARGWSLNSMQSPASVHVCMTANVAPKVDELLRDLKETVALAKEAAPNGLSKEGTAGIYGMTESLPPGPVEHVLRFFLDLLLTP